MIKLYYHNGSTNHGCEAIVRATQKILNCKNIILYSRKPDTDFQYKLNDIVEIQADIAVESGKYSFTHIYYALYRKLKKSNYMQTILTRENFFSNLRKNDICFSIGGDNYCYEGKEVLGFYNKGIHKKGGKTVLWGCSFEVDHMTEKLKEDIASYDLIIARESISFNLLKKYNSNTYLIPDPAFQLERKEPDLPDLFKENNTVGINISPLIMKCETIRGITKTNYEELIEYIIRNTDMNIALIPHVVEKNNDDREVLKLLFKKYKKTKRICMIEDCNCMELKGYIEKCRFFIGARTHATIAAYSSCVPTLVVGYSVKAKGIAKDIFGEYENYVLSVQGLKRKDDLLKSFLWLQKEEKNIQEHLKKIMPKYCEKVLESKEKIDILLGDQYEN